MTAAEVQQALLVHANFRDVAFLQGFFKTGQGQYGEGDVFIGVRVPQTRAVCKDFKNLPLNEVQKLLNSEIHEHRLAGLVILTLQFPKADARQQKAIFDLYLENARKGRINNWDLVDLSADRIVGAYLFGTSAAILYELARSRNLWEKRIAMLSTFWFIKKGEPAIALGIAEILLHDTHDLIQKAVGWMLREIGKRCDKKLLTDFLDLHATTMPRTALRYSLERLSPEQKKYYMQRKATAN